MKSEELQQMIEEFYQNFSKEKLPTEQWLKDATAKLEAFIRSITDESKWDIKKNDDLMENIQIVKRTVMELLSTNPQSIFEFQLFLQTLSYLKIKNMHAYLDRQPIYLCSLYMNWKDFLSDKLIDLKDYSFVENNTRQSVVGKGKKGSKQYPIYPSGLLCFMSVGYFYTDKKNKIQYDSAIDKKSKKLSKVNGQLLIGSQQAQDGEYIYILSPKGGVYLIQDSEDVHHSIARAGQPVLCAGNLHISNGRISYIDASSGHYKPTSRNLFFSAQWLHDSGYIEQSCKLGKTDFGAIPEEEKAFYRKQ